MLSKNYLSRPAFILILVICATVIPIQARAESPASVAVPNLSAFIATVKNGDADMLRGLYIPQALALPVIQQPKDNAQYVSTREFAATQFSMAAKEGVVGLLAHNTLAGKFFFNVEKDAELILVYGDGRTETFIVKNILRYETLPRGMFKNIETQDVLDTKELFEFVYSGERHVTLQTCIENEGDANWGRLFVIAKPSANKNAEKKRETTVEKKRAKTTMGWPLPPPHLRIKYANMETDYFLAQSR